MKIGPIMGIMSIPRDGEATFIGTQGESFAEIISLAERMSCTAFVFSPFELDWVKGAVWGYHYNMTNNEWNRRLFPLPTVIYNRLPNRSIENRDDIRQLTYFLKKNYGPNFFNPCFLDKLKTHTILSGSRDTKVFLPKTARLTGVEIITNMLNTFGSLYLKPSAKSLGSDIFKLSRLNDKYHFIHQNFNQLPREGIVSDCSVLISELPVDTGYLVQQDVKLAKFRNRTFDLRFLVQKDCTGQWRKTGVAARIAGEGSITTHVFYGGSRFPAEKVIKSAANRYRFSFDNVMDQFKKISTVIPHAIERGYGDSFGELEMDLGIDRNGKVWFLEANSKPFKFDEPLIRAKSLVRLIHYIRFLDSRLASSEHDIGYRG